MVWRACVYVDVDTGCVLFCVCVCVCVCGCMFLVQFYQAWHDVRGGIDLVLADARVHLIHGIRCPTSPVAAWVIDWNATHALKLTTIRTNYMPGVLALAVEPR